jgi:hypothetical protein
MKSLDDTRISVVTCNRDKWTFEKQYKLIAKLGYTGEYSIWCNEKRQSSWHHWFYKLQKKVPTSANVILNDIHTVPGISHPTDKVLSNFWQAPYWQQQFIKLWDAWQNKNYTTISLDSKTWPVHPQFYLANMLYIKPTNKIIDTPFDRINDFVKIWTGKPSTGITRGNIPPFPLSGRTLRKHIPDWNLFIETIKNFNWNGSTFSEYYFVEQLYAQDRYKPSGINLDHLTLDKHQGNLKTLNKLLATEKYHYFTHKWQDPTQNFILNGNKTFKIVYDNVSKHMLDKY